MNYHLLHLLLVVLATLLQIATCFTFTARPLFSLPPCLPIMTRFAGDSTSDNVESEDVSSSSSFSEPDPQQPIPQQQPREEANRKQQRPMDPLLASLTRMDNTSTTSSSTKTTVPLFGEIDMDGSLLVLIPAIVLAVVGFVMSIVIAFNSQDAIVDSLTQLSDDIAAAALAKTNTPISSSSSCRGICSSQETDLQLLKTFMDNISKK